MRTSPAMAHPIDLATTAALGRMSLRWLMVACLAIASAATSAATWSGTAHLQNGHDSHTATLLPNGKVLVVGRGTATNELYDPATNQWTATDKLSTSKKGHVATLLSSGKVLVASGPLEVFNPNASTNVWTPVGNQRIERHYHTGTLLPNGKVLYIGGSTSPDFDKYTGVPIATAEIYDADKNTSTYTKEALPEGRARHTATLLPSGKVLVVGGEIFDRSTYTNTATSSVKIYDPDTDSWASAKSLTTARSMHSATLLPDGRVLVVGGRNFDPFEYQGGGIPTPEIYNPQQDTWSPAGQLVMALRYSHSATLLPNGQVLVSGGCSASYNPYSIYYHLTMISASALYSPESNLWSAGPDLSNDGRCAHTATLLSNGKVLAAGSNNSNSGTSEIFDPSPSTSWTDPQALLTTRDSHTATLLPNGKVLFAGGFGSSAPLADAELYDPTSKTRIHASPLPEPRYGHRATLAADGSVVVSGGSGSNYTPLATTALYDSTHDSWFSGGDLTTARQYHTATLLADGKILVAGGSGLANNGAALSAAEKYNPDTKNWSAAGQFSEARYKHTATMLPNGKVLVTGGAANGAALGSTELYDPEHNVWSPTRPMITARYAHSASLLPNGKVLVSGGTGVGADLSSAEMYDPVADSWVAVGSLAVARSGHVATTLSNGDILVMAGSRYGSTAANLYNYEIYSPARNTWEGSGGFVTGGVAPGFARTYHTATLLPNGRVLVAGGSNGVPMNAMDSFDPGFVPDAGRQPVLYSATSPLTAGNAVVVTANNLRPYPSASSGATNDSASNIPAVQVMRLDNGQRVTLSQDLLVPFTNTGFTSTTNSLDGFPMGSVLVSAVVNGIPSKAQFSVLTPPGYTILSHAIPAAGGSVNCTPNPVASRSSSTCLATANTGYSFFSWSGDCMGSAGTPCTLSDITSAKNVTATFNPNAYTITATANPPAGGTVSCLPSPAYYGSPASCTATANAGYRFTSWNGSCSGVGTTCNFNSVTGNMSVTANFTGSLPSQTITLGTAPTVSVGGTGTLSATASSGLAVTFTSTTTGICSVSGSTVTGIAPGLCVIAANQAGNSSYSPTSLTQSFSITEGLYTQTLEKIYIAYFGRPADPSGLNYWNDELVTGQGSDRALQNIFTAFSISTEYISLHAGQTTEQLVESLYLYLYGRTADAGGLSYWVQQVQSGANTLDRVAYIIATAANNDQDRLVIDNKVSAASTFTAHLDTAAEMLRYKGTPAFDSARSFLGTVKASLPGDAVIDAAIAALP